MRRFLFPLALLPLAGCLSTAPETPRPAGPPEEDEILSELAVFTEALYLAKQDYVEEVSFRDLLYGALDGMLQSLDPNSYFMPPEAYTEFQEESSGEFCGIGVTVDMDDTGLRVIAPIDGSPAAQAGILPGDYILAVDGKKVEGESFNDIVKRMRGERGTKVVLTVRRSDGEKQKFTLTRDDIKVASVRFDGEIKDGIGVMRVSSFTEKTPDEFTRALARFRERGGRGLVLDLRDNPGGLLDSAVAIAEILLPRGSVIVSVKGRRAPNDERSVYKAGACPGRDRRLPLAVLVNESSASASEVLAGALQAHGRAPVIGVQTYGKASVQNIIPLENRASCAVRMTTGYYYTPAGICIHGEGIQPDIEVPLPEKVWRKLQKARSDRRPPGKLRDAQLERAINELKKSAGK
ncbi:MAG: S41 family peptidase [Kiritimatiellae bacterium]|nr:S41 family peptidase [Kiritimatiellia bacterium]